MDYNETYIDHLQSVQNNFNIVMVPILLLCGTAGNVISFTIYVRKWSAYTIPLLFLSCMDLLFLWSESIFSGYWVYFKESLETTTFGCKYSYRLISVVDVVGPMNPYQPIPFHILSFDVFQSRILIYASSNIYDL